KEHKLRYYGIDPFLEPEDAYPRWMAMAQLIGAPYRIAKMKSERAVIQEPIHACLIDGNHEYDYVLDDLNHYAPLIAQHGYLMMHDYSRDSLPDVYRAARNYFGNWAPQWEEGNPVGTLGIWRRR